RARNAHHGIEHPRAAKRHGDWQRSVCVQLYANAGGRIRGNCAGSVRLGAEWITVVSGGAVAAVRGTGCAGSARRAQAPAAASSAVDDREVISLHASFCGGGPSDPVASDSLL